MYYIIIMVIAMTINIITEPEYKDTVWCRETLCGIEKKAASQRYKTKICSFDMLSADMENIIVVGTSPGYVASILCKTTLLGIRAIVISCQPVETREKNQLCSHRTQLGNKRMYRVFAKLRAKKHSTLRHQSKFICRYDKNKIL